MSTLSGVVVLSILGMSLIASGARAAPLGGRTRLVRVGQLSLLQRHATALGAAEPNSPISFEIVLPPRNGNLLTETARAVTTIGSPQFHRFLQKGAFDREFGASNASIGRIKRTLASLGLRNTEVSSNRLVIIVRSTIATTDRALHTKILRYRSPSGSSFEAPNVVPTLPSSVAPDVSAILGLDTAPSIASSGLVHEPQLKASTTAHTASGAYSGVESPPCSADIASAHAGLTPDQVANAYGLSSLYASGDVANGVTIGVIEFSSFVRSDLAAYASCLGIVPNVTEVNVAGGPIGADVQNGPVASDMLEAELDLEDLIGLAPGASIITYEGPSQGGKISNSAAYDAYATAINADAAQVITTSYGVCEAAITPAETKAENTLFEQAALQGQTVVAAAGDSGSEDCSNGFASSSSSRQNALEVDDPASQPYVTGVGGTTLTLEPQRSEVVWNTGTTDAEQFSAGGGGVSTTWPMPAYQANAASALGVAQAGRSVGTCQISSGCREVPDIAMDAGTPYAIYCSIAGAGCGSDGSNWAPLGGTSAAAPAFAAIVALTDSSQACSLVLPKPSPTIGFLNPSLYAIAAGANYASDFTDIVLGSNDLYGVHGGAYSAAPGYDLASGLGSPLVANASNTGLVADLCTISSLDTALADGGLGTPRLRSLSPTFAATTGGRRVSISGVGLRGTLQVLFGTTPASSFTILSNRHVVATAPPGLGRVHVSVIGRGGVSPIVRAATFTYLAAPSISRIAPPRGPTSGHNTITIIGNGFAATSAVVVGKRPALSFRIRSKTRIVAIVPPGHGVVRVEITTKVGRSSAVAGDRYTYR